MFVAARVGAWSNTILPLCTLQIVLFSDQLKMLSQDFENKAEITAKQARNKNRKVELCCILGLLGSDEA
jgi:hypothetical protein